LVAGVGFEPTTFRLRAWRAGRAATRKLRGSNFPPRNEGCQELDEIADSASARPICTLERAGVSGRIREPFGRHLWQRRSTHPGRWAARQWRRNNISRNVASYNGSGALTASARRHQIAVWKCQLAQPFLIRLWQRSSKHLH